jgi:hypothetical protein
MIKFLLTAATLVSAVALGTTALAQNAPAPTPVPSGNGPGTPVPPVPGAQRQSNQQGRIADGLENGQLTGREAAKLEGRQAKIDKAQNRANADGVISDAERKHVQHLEQKEAKMINHKTTNKKGPAPTPPAK